MPPRARRQARAARVAAHPARGRHSGCRGDLVAAVARLTGLTLSWPVCPPGHSAPLTAGHCLAPPILDGGVRAALGGPNGVDQLTLAHRASALDSKGAGQLLQLGEDHGVQAGALAIATIAGELLTLLAGAFLMCGGTRHFGDFCQCVSLSVLGTSSVPIHGAGFCCPAQRVFLEVLSASRRLFSRCG